MIIKAIIETPKGSKKKYELKGGKLKLDQILRPGFIFPGNYGFIPETMSGDGDALDVLVLSTRAIKPKKVIKIRPIALMRMIDGEKQDDKVIAVSIRSKKKKLKKAEMAKIEYFFKHYKRRKITIKGFVGVERAKKAIIQAKRAYGGKNVLQKSS